MMNQLEPTPINPTGFTNTNNIQGVFGEQMPNTFTRNVNNPYSQPSMEQGNALSTPVPPPAGVETPITPKYDINNY
jgi:hypothetical protein